MRQHKMKYVFDISGCTILYTQIEKIIQSKITFLNTRKLKFIKLNHFFIIEF